MPQHSIAIVGAGALGTALAHAFAIAGVRVAAIASRRPERAAALAAAIPGTHAVPLGSAGAAAPTVVLSVSDSAIEDACAAIGAKRGTLVAHASGFRDISALAVARAAGAGIGGFHPLAAVARGDAARLSPADCVATFRGAAFAIEGETDVCERLALLARALGGTPFTIAAADKPLYHLGASMLAAFGAGLAQVAWEQLRSAGAPTDVASRGVAHLLRTVAGNVERLPTPATALTGPVARGDAEGVRRQAAAARALSPAAQELYRVHVAHNIELARAAGRIDERAAGQLLAVLREDEKTR